MTERLGSAIGKHWGGVVRAMDLINGVAAFGALGGVSALIQAAASGIRQIRQQQPLLAACNHGQAGGKQARNVDHLQ